MQQYLKQGVLILATAALLTACGGGGGSSSSTVTTASVSGVAMLTTGPSSSAEASKASSSVPAESALEGARVTITSFDKSGVEKSKVSTVTTSGGGFSASITPLNGGGTINIKIEGEGTITFEKSFEYTSSSELTQGLNLIAKLDPVNVKTISTGATDFDAQAAKTAATTDIISMAVVKDSRGVKTVVSNSKIAAAKAAGSQVIWQFDVAKSALKADTQSLTMKVQNYNPANPDDMTRFPAENDDTGNKLVSASFDFIDIKDQNGAPLVISKASAAKARKTAAIAYAIKKQIPACSLIIKDENATKPGVQIGFYFMYNGKWSKLGEATLYKQDLETPFALTDSCSSSSLPYAVLTDADISKDINFNVQYFNFDYVAFGTITETCVEGSFELSKNGVASPLGGLSLYLNSFDGGLTGFQSAYGTVSQDGKYRLNFVYTDGTPDGKTANFSYYDYISGNSDNVSLALSSSKNSNGCYTVAKKTVIAPGCTVTGKLLKADGSTPAANEYVQIYENSTYRNHRSIQTNSQGIYESPVFCSMNYRLSAGGATKSFNVNNTKTADENTDDGTTSTMNDITKINQAPYAYISSNSTSVTANSTSTLSGYGYDSDGDSLTYGWAANCGTLSATTGQNVTWTAPSTDGACTITLTVNDGSTNTSTATELFVGSRPPVISSLFVPGSVGSGKNANLYMYAYDLDSQNLTYSWSVNQGCPASLSNSTTATPTFTANSTDVDASCAVTASVSDGAATATKTRTINITPNRAPVISSMVVPQTVTLSSITALLGYAADYDGDNFSWEWSKSGSGTLSGTCSGNSSNGIISTGSCSYIAPPSAASSQITLTLTYGNGQTVVQTKSVSVIDNSGNSTTVTVE